MNKTANKLALEVHLRVERLVFDSVSRHGSRWQVIVLIAERIGCSFQTNPTQILIE